MLGAAPARWRAQIYLIGASGVVARALVALFPVKSGAALEDCTKADVVVHEGLRMSCAQGQHGFVEGKRGLAYTEVFLDGGGGGIRTHVAVTPIRFQDGAVSPGSGTPPVWYRMWCGNWFLKPIVYGGGGGIRTHVAVTPIRFRNGAVNPSPAPLHNAAPLLVRARFRNRHGGRSGIRTHVAVTPIRFPSGAVNPSPAPFPGLLLFEWSAALDSNQASRAYQARAFPTKLAAGMEPPGGFEPPTRALEGPCSVR